MSNEFIFIEAFLSSAVGFLLFSLVSYSTLLASRQILIFNFFWLSKISEGLVNSCLPAQPPDTMSPHKLPPKLR